MPLISEWKPGQLNQTLIFGPAKSGKTWGAYTYPRCVGMDFDHGIATVTNPDFVKKYGNGHVVFYEQFDETHMKGGVPLQHNAFDDSCRLFDEWMKPVGQWKDRRTGKTYPTGRDHFDTWVIDSGTALSNYAQNKAVILLGRMSPPLSKTHAEAIGSGLIIPRIQDYGSERSLVEQFVDMVLSSGKNVVFICHEKEVTDDNGNVIRIEPLLTGKSSEVVPMKFDEVYNLRVRKMGLEVVRQLVTKPDGLRKVGSRYGVPDGIEWSYDSVNAALAKTREERDSLAAPSQKPALP